ncbi:MAG: hypothetical protein IT364_18765 [Candidatus Hydrogenedentes bacterium]|nr:hypothetical protein [Candidatus Hydrogenedentota bacterium]
MGFSLAAAMVHPVGLEVGIIGLATVAIVALWEMRGGTDRRDALKTLASVVGCGVVLAVLGYVFWIRPYAPLLDVERLRGIYAYLRVPHHIVPSTFPLKDWGLLLVFLVAGALMGCGCYVQEQIDRRMAIRCAVATGVVLVICAMGYVGVEIIPVRAIITGNVYRLLYVVKWIGLMVVGGMIAASFRARPDTGRHWFGLALWAANGPWHPPLILGTWLLCKASEAAGAMVRRHAGAFILVCVLVALARWGHREEGGALCVYGLVALWFLVVRSAWIRSTLPILGCVALAGVLAAGRSYPEAGWSRWSAKYQPIIWLEDSQDEVYQIGRFVEANTRQEAVLLVPPDLARFRLTAERAVVVDFKAFPFNDEAMEEWYQRVVFCYGPFESAYHHQAGQVLNNYLTISDEHMAAIRERYGATHAVLFPATETRYPVLLEMAGYKVVAIPGGG